MAKKLKLTKSQFDHFCEEHLCLKFGKGKTLEVAVVAKCDEKNCPLGIDSMCTYSCPSQPCPRPAK